MDNIVVPCFLTHSVHAKLFMPLLTSTNFT